MLDISTFAPSPGTAKPGNLYADLQTRTLWLGVDPAVDPAQAVLISDILALQAEIDGSLVEAKAYTDTKILTRAPTVHTHTASQITDFSGAVTSVVAAIPTFNWVTNMIMMYSGSLANIGIGGLAGWGLCDGSQGTPDLREKFILGAGSRAVGAKNTQTAFDTVAAGSHDHVIGATALGIAHLPSHSHGGITGFMTADHSHFVNINSGTESVFHQHDTGLRTGQNGSAGASAGSSSNSGTVYTSNQNQLHYHNVQGQTGGASANHQHAVNAEGGGAAHGHTISFSGSHVHNITNLQLRETLPFYALAYIMKL